MGKSIQGAGGALVLGVVFLSFIKRTQMIVESQNKSPERWIKECFYELQTIFESFDGSMLVSVVLGLVEEDTGVLYYLNAEHPWTVLYRDENASFIEDELELRKIGTKGMEGDVRVRIFHLKKVMFCSLVPMVEMIWYWKKTKMEHAKSTKTKPSF